MLERSEVSCHARSPAGYPTSPSPVAAGNAGPGCNLPARTELRSRSNAKPSDRNRTRADHIRPQEPLLRLYRPRRDNPVESKRPLHRRAAHRVRGSHARAGRCRGSDPARHRERLRGARGGHLPGLERAARHDAVLEPADPENQFFFNDRDPETGKVFAVLFDIAAGRRVREYRFDDTPVGNGGVSFDGKYFAGSTTRAWPACA